MLLLVSQRSFLSMAEVFQGALTPHCAGAVGLRFEVCKLERSASARITRPAPGIVFAQAAVGVGGPARVERAVSTLDDVYKYL